MFLSVFFTPLNPTDHSSFGVHALACLGSKLRTQNASPSLTDGNRAQPTNTSPEGPSGAPVCALADWFLPRLWTMDVGLWTIPLSDPNRAKPDGLIGHWDFLGPWSFDIEPFYRPDDLAARVRTPCGTIIRPLPITAICQRAPLQKCHATSKTYSRSLLSLSPSTINPHPSSNYSLRPIAQANRQRHR